MGFSATEELARKNGVSEYEFEIIRNQLLADYIKGYTSYGDIRDTLKTYGIRPVHKHYFVISLFVRDYGMLKDDAQKDTTFIINNILEDLLNMEDIYFTKTDSMACYIINCPEPPRDGRIEVVERFREANRLINDIFEISFVAGISGIKSGLESLPELYNEAVMSVDYARFYDVSEFVYYSDINREYRENERHDRVFPRETELVLDIKTGRMDKIEKTIDLMFSAGGGRILEKWYYQGLAYNILNNILSVTENVSMSAYEEIIEEANSVGNDPTIKDIKALLCRAGKIACRCYKTESEKSTSIYAMTRRYIGQHYMDHNLDISTLGEAFNMTGFYISRIFKQHSGMKVTKYVNELRVERAKKMLLENTKMKISEVGWSVGFDNQRTFLKIFKEIEGVTPTQYRNANII